jgi:hypothetical protein
MRTGEWEMQKNAQNIFVGKAKQRGALGDVRILRGEGNIKMSLK